MYMLFFTSMDPGKTRHSINSGNFCYCNRFFFYPSYSVNKTNFVNVKTEENGTVSVISTLWENNKRNMINDIASRRQVIAVHVHADRNIITCIKWFLLALCLQVQQIELTLQCLEDHPVKKMTFSFHWVGKRGQILIPFNNSAVNQI